MKQAPGFELALKRLRQSLEDAPGADAFADEAALVRRIDSAQQHGPPAAAAPPDGAGSGGGGDGDGGGTAAQKQPLMLGPPM
jgi:hypothetical protein